uniref:ATP synthase F0 subunit 8 n=1 Tax=Mytilus trossulus TaxID=6551 RepID=A0A076JSA5_MYTTR|nr:ATP synthase F0 subunit 8 [Mytilus trossulus]
MRNEFWWEVIVSGLLLLLEVYCVYLWFMRRECFCMSPMIEKNLNRATSFEKVYLTKAYSKKNMEGLKSNVILEWGKASPKLKAGFRVEKPFVEFSWLIDIYEGLLVYFK